jgi:hypothetical protein
MAEWDPERERYERERDFTRDYVEAGLGQRGPDGQPLQHTYGRGVWSIGGKPRGAPSAPWADEDPRQTEGPHVGKGPRNWTRSDERIHDEVCAALERHGHVDASGMDVAVQGGEVTLSGNVPERSMKRLAEDVAAACAGVRDVHNRLRVG